MARAGRPSNPSVASTINASARHSGDENQDERYRPWQQHCRLAEMSATCSEELVEHERGKTFIIFMNSSELLKFVQKIRMIVSAKGAGERHYRPSSPSAGGALVIGG